MCERRSNRARERGWGRQRTTISPTPLPLVWQLLEIWPRVKASLPDARLSIYHGFPPDYGQPGSAPGAPAAELARMRALRARVEALLQRARERREGVEEHGMVDQVRFASAILNSSYCQRPLLPAQLERAT